VHLSQHDATSTVGGFNSHAAATDSVDAEWRHAVELVLVLRRS
jgi:hypothetical protein